MPSVPGVRLLRRALSAEDTQKLRQVIGSPSAGKCMCCNYSLLAVPSKSNFPFFRLSFPKAQHSAVAPLLCPVSRRFQEVPILLSPLFSRPCVSWQDLSDVLVCSSALFEEKKGERCKIGGSFSHHLLVACRQASLLGLFLGAKEKWLLWSEGCPAPALSHRVPRPSAAAAAGPAQGSGAQAVFPCAHPVPAVTGSIFVSVKKRNAPDGPTGRACLPKEDSIL